MSDLPGFHIKYAGFEIEYYSQDSTTVTNEYRKAIEWLKDTVEKTLNEMRSEINQLKDDMAELRTCRLSRPEA